MANESPVDRIIRLIAAVVIFLIAFNYVSNPVLLWALYIISAVLLITAITGFCPLYNLLGINTNKN